MYGNVLSRMTSRIRHKSRILWVRLASVTRTRAYRLGVPEPRVRVPEACVRITEARVRGKCGIYFPHGLP